MATSSDDEEPMLVALRDNPEAGRARVSSTATAEAEPAAVPRPCFLCAYAAEPRVVEYSNYIIKEIARSGVDEIALQICADIVQEHRTAPPDINVTDVTEHSRAVIGDELIVSHMAHPTVKLAAMLRELDDVRRALHRSVYAVDTDSGAAVLDAGAVRLYLQVVSAQQNLYKLGDPTRLAFGQRAGAEGAAVDA